ncbi:hyaluronan synthase HasA [Actinocorallia longicatena]|uniref:Hyaluronan synthase HasA n=2 Tax=Actinocorallia longicatena TaxID=111803 RepID=A0ABP6Q9G9_9ACTN
MVGGGSRVRGFAVFAVIAVAWFEWAGTDEFGPLGPGMLILLVIKLLLASCYRNRRATGVGAAGVVLVIPTFNEDLGTLRRCLLSILDQEVLPPTVVMVDDGNADDGALLVGRSLVQAFGARGSELDVLRQPANLGKREALVRAFLSRPDARVYITIDSDTVLRPDAVRELLVGLADERVTAVTGVVLAANARTNVLTRLLDLRYANAFLYERAAYSVLGSVLCCCGSLSAYRGEVVRRHLDDFRHQRFLGRPAIIGDDRRLTNYCLSEGRVLLQSTAVAETMVPERVGHFLRQQARWNRSFFRESLWCLRTFALRRPMAWLLSAVEMTSWVVFTSTLLYALLVAPFLQERLLILPYATMIATFGYLRSVRYLDLRRPGTTTFQQLCVFAMAPLYGLMHILLLLPLRLFCLLTLTRTGWGTRETVEISMASADLAHDLREPDLV